VDFLYFLEARLRFIQHLYHAAKAPFEEIKRKIEADEPPYQDTRNPEDFDEPAFLTEWQQADDSVRVIGYWCLCMVQASLKAYLKEFIGPTGRLREQHERLNRELAKKQGGSWFGRYRLLFREDLGVEWSDGPVDLAELEQLNLTRDDVIHNIDMFTIAVERGGRHMERYPIGLFVDELWQEIGADRVRIDATRLELAIRLVREFCTWLDHL
jgi:hypothetical protein